MGTYRRILDQRGVDPDRFLMVGNSVRSDILPVLQLGGRAAHVPYHVTWELERVEPSDHHDFPVLRSIRELPSLLADLGDVDRR